MHAVFHISEDELGTRLADHLELKYRCQVPKRMYEYLLSEAVIDADESVLQVFDDPKKGNNYM